jgi:hypothetical protein
MRAPIGLGAGIINSRIASNTTRKLTVVFRFERVQLFDEFLVDRDHSAEPDERSDDVNTGLDGHGTLQHRGR